MSELTQDGDTGEALIPPSARRVAERALVMSIVTCRGFVEQDRDAASEFWGGVRSWFETLGLSGEVEPWEKQVIECPLGRLDAQLQANSTWLCEGLTVLAWALGRFALLPHDQAVVAAEVSEALGFRVPKEGTVLASPRLRTPEEISALSNRMFAVHWRLRDFNLSKRQMNFKSFSETAWFGPLDIEGVRLIADDLAIGDAPIGSAKPNRFRECLSIAVERHRAANWLLGHAAVYSETDTST